MIQTNAELFLIGELKDISKGEILSVGICILNRDRNIIGLDHRIQPLTLRHTVSGYCAGVLAGNIPGFCMYQEGRTLHIHCGMLCDTEGECHQFAVGNPGFNAQLCGTSIQLLIQNFDLDQCVIQPNSSIIALTHHTELNAVAAGVALGLLVSKCMDGLPIGKRVVAGMLCILQNIIVAFLQKVNMPALAVAELDLHTGTLLEVKVTCALLCKALVILQIYTEGEISVGCIAEDLALAAQLVQ